MRYQFDVLSKIDVVSLIIQTVFSISKDESLRALFFLPHWSQKAGDSIHGKEQMAAGKGKAVPGRNVVP